MKTKKLINKSQLIIGVVTTGILILLGTVIAILHNNSLFLKSNNELAILDVDQSLEECLSRRLLDGVCNKEDAGALAIMIDNHSDAWPPAGINQASIVYEAIVEAPITRLLAIFDLSEKVEMIGPVRSARPYYVDWATEFNGVYAHVGGSDAALALIKNRNIIDFNEFNNGQYYWRDNSRFAPHNTFISMENIQKMLADKDISVQKIADAWQFKDEAELENRGLVESIKIDYKNLVYNINWQYDREKNLYQRTQGNRQYNDAEGVPVTAKNIAVMYVESSVIDDYGRRQTQVLGSGEAQVFLDGKNILATWRRASIENRTKFYDQQGEEIKFNAGLTWIQVIPNHFPQVTIEPYAQ